MEIKKTRDGDELTVAVSGRLDTTTAPQLEEALKPELGNVKKLTFDFEGLEYISSAGLRILLQTAQSMDDMSDMVVTHTNSDIDDIFEVTGFSEILNIVK